MGAAAELPRLGGAAHVEALPLRLVAEAALLLAEGDAGTV